MGVVVRGGPHIFLSSAAGGRNHIGVGPNFHLNRTGSVPQEVMKDFFLKNQGCYSLRYKSRRFLEGFWNSSSLAAF